MKEKAAFSIGTGVVVFAVALGCGSSADGPWVENPSGGSNEFGFFRPNLDKSSTPWESCATRFQSLRPFSRKIFWILLFFGLLITASSYLLDAGQWQITHRHLSAALRKSFVPIGVICGIVGMLLTARTGRTPSLDA
jgi:hypothetical protein